MHKSARKKKAADAVAAKSVSVRKAVDAVQVEHAPVKTALAVERADVQQAAVLKVVANKVAVRPVDAKLANVTAAEAAAVDVVNQKSKPSK